MMMNMLELSLLNSQNQLHQQQQEQKRQQPDQPVPSHQHQMRALVLHHQLEIQVRCFQSTRLNRNIKTHLTF